MEHLPKALSSILARVFRGTFSARHADLNAVFQSFKAVLASNNKALEIITDMGEKLGGDYIFDISYIMQSYSRLSSSVKTSIDRFDILTRGKYDLKEVYGKIDSLVRRAVYGESTFGEMVVPFEDITWDMSRAVGGKSYNLSLLRNSLGLNVPDGFALTGHAYDEFIRHNGLAEEIKGLDADAASFSERVGVIRGSILQGEFPEALSLAIEKALERLIEHNPGAFTLAVRSSAEEEDGEYSFAGLFETVLNVPPTTEAFMEAYKRVVASLFSPESAAYYAKFGYHPSAMKMPVGCVLMVDARASGVVYTADPVSGSDTLIVNATWGLGAPVVQGKVDSDVYLFEKKPALRLIEVRTGRKEMMETMSPEDGGTRTREVPEDMRNAQCLTEEEAAELAGLAVKVENHFRRPEDIEWALDGEGRIVLLQARPLRVNVAEAEETPRVSAPAGHRALLKDKGFVVQRGTVGGKVHILKNPSELDTLPRGAVLVARHDSPQFVRAMPYLSAIITDVGTQASHMASICREFRIPAVVGAGDATRFLKQGQEITLSADEDGNYTVYDGLVEELLRQKLKSPPDIDELYEFRKRRYIMRYISPLNLVNPLTDDFTPGKCKTMHDILRFIHEKSVQELIETSKHASGRATLRRLDLPIPAGIQLIDIGGGISPDAKDPVTFEQVESKPLRAILEGMMFPGVWHSEATSLRARDFLSSMMRMGDITTEGEMYAGNNIAVISKEYLNLTLRFGYHFNLVDSYLSEKAANNHIYFRFVGGATDITKRSRRIQLIDRVLREYGFISKTKGDLILARLSHVGEAEILRILDQAGRLIAFTRQLDVELQTDGDVEKYGKRFLAGEYRI